MQFTIKDSGFRRRLEMTKTMMPNRIKDAVKKGTQLMWKEVLSTTPTSFGDLKKSISATVDGFSGTIRPTVKYAKDVHEGTRPHWIAVKEAMPGGSLFRWAQRKGASPWAVRAGIAKKGTKARPWMRDAFEANNDRVVEIFEEAIDGVIKGLGK